MFMFLEETKICNYVDDTTIHVCGPEIETVFKYQERVTLTITARFPNNFTKVNEDKCHLMIFGAK